MKHRSDVPRAGAGTSRWPPKLTIVIVRPASHRVSGSPLTIAAMLTRHLPDPPTLIGPIQLLAAHSLPMLAMLGACGFPSPAEDFFREDDRLDLNDKLIANPPATFIVQADCGGSMVDFGIQNGDLLIVDRSISARPGHTVVVLWEGGFMVKKLYRRGNNIVLAAGASFETIVVPPDVEVDIWGVVRSNIHFHL